MYQLIKKFKSRLSSIYIRFIRKIKFWHFESLINSNTYSAHDSILDWANLMHERNYIGNAPFCSMYLLGESLKIDVLNSYRDKYLDLKKIRILVHLPSKIISPGGHSVFLNMIQSLQYLGIACRGLEWGESIKKALDDFKPSIFLTSDNDEYINIIDWVEIKRYQDKNDLKIGLTASIEPYGNTPLDQRLKRAEQIGTSFFFSFRAQEYLRNRMEYRPFFDRNHSVISMEFGANPLHYYPVSGLKRDLPYVFLASSNSDKQDRYRDWLMPLLRKHAGFLDGPGWSHLKRYANISAHKYLYSRAKVGLNLHIQDSIDWDCELNERTYILAACGVPQLIDNPKLLFSRFSAEAVFSAKNPKEYVELFEYISNSPAEASQRAEVALIEVFSRHTTFHRAEKFLQQLINVIK